MTTGREIFEVSDHNVVGWDDPNLSFPIEDYTAYQEGMEQYQHFASHTPHHLVDTPPSEMNLGRNGKKPVPEDKIDAFFSNCPSK